VNCETQKSRVFPCMFEFESVRALLCCECAKAVESVQLGVVVISRVSERAAV